MHFQHFNPAHILILVLIPLCAWLLAVWGKQQAKWSERIRMTLGCIIGANELIWYGYTAYHGWIYFPFGLPLDLCDLVLWLTVFTLFTRTRWSFDLIYYWGLVGTGMAVLTPDMGMIFPSYGAIKFLVAHGCVVMAILYLLWSNNAHPRIHSWWKSLLWVDVYAVVIGSFNAVFKTNYFYLCQKPQSGSLLEYLGPWPWYIAGGEILAVMLFFLLWIPFRKNSLPKSI
jgi:hypothetical integral membrane protein (TIGR02206 family)